MAPVCPDRLNPGSDLPTCREPGAKSTTVRDLFVVVGRVAPAFSAILIATWFVLGPPAAEARLAFSLDLDYWSYFTQPLQNPFPPPLQDAEVRESELNANAYLMIPMGQRKSSFRVEFHYGWLVHDWDEVSKREGLPRFDRSVDMELGLTYRGRYDSPWGVQVSFVPGLAADESFSNLSSGHVTIQGGAWLLRYFSSRLILGLGGYRTFDFGEPEIYPSLLVEYDPGGRYYIKGILPSTFEAFYYVWRTLKLGLVFEARGMRYRQETDELRFVEDPFMADSAIMMGGGIGYAFDNKLAFRIDAGYLLDRKLRILDGDDTLLNLDPGRGPFLRATMSFGGN